MKAKSILDLQDQFHKDFDKIIVALWFASKCSFCQNHSDTIILQNLLSIQTCTKLLKWSKLILTESFPHMICSKSTLTVNLLR
jgi:hypothetical protein